MMVTYGAPHATDVPPPYTRAAPAYSSANSSAASSLFSSDTLESDLYEYGSKPVTLRFSQRKRRGVRLPAYGRGGIISGDIELHSSNHIESVNVSLRGEVKTVIENSRRPTLASTTVLFEQEYNIWSRSNEVHASSTPYLIPFSFSFPSNVKGQDAPLPPSFAGAVTEATARVKYTVVAHVRRVGWRSNTRVETEVFYLPRSVQATALPNPPSLELMNTPKESPYDWKITELAVNRMAEGKKARSEITTHLACPASFVPNSGQAVSFNAYISSSTQPVERLLSLVPHISARLVRSTSIVARGSTVTEETVVAHGDIQNSDLRGEAGGRTICLTGWMDLSDASWTSWAVPGAVTISYALRITLPPSVQPEFAYFDHSEPLVALSESSRSSPSSPDLAAVPSPAALIKKTLVYMPMRV